MAANITVLELPPKLSFSNQVRMESRKGTNSVGAWDEEDEEEEEEDEEDEDEDDDDEPLDDPLDFFPCSLVVLIFAKADITRPMVVNDVLILAASFRLIPVTPDSFTLSLPAKSTKHNLLRNISELLDNFVKYNMKTA